jgi:hypothetical protein
MEAEVLERAVSFGVGDHVVSDDQPEAGSDEDRRSRNKSGLDQEARLHHPTAEADCA